MFPLRDANPTELSPVVTIGLITLNTLIWLYEWTLSESVELLIFFDRFAIVPAQLLNDFPAEAFTYLRPCFYVTRGLI